MHAATEPEQENDIATDKKIARRKLSLLELASELQNVSKACKVMGYSRQQFYEIDCPNRRRRSRDPNGKPLDLTPLAAAQSGDYGVCTARIKT